jgi:hypothetical protein
LISVPIITALYENLQFPESGRHNQQEVGKDGRRSATGAGGGGAPVSVSTSGSGNASSSSSIQQREPASYIFYVSFVSFSVLGNSRE